MHNRYLILLVPFLMDAMHLKVIKEMKNCSACDLARNRSQVVVGDYGPTEGICFVGEAPGQHEDEQGRPFVGRSGQLLDTMLEQVGLSRKTVSVLNICKCRPPNNRNPTTGEQQVCGKLWLEQQLDYLNPKLLVTLGSVPLGYFIPGRRITRSKGKLIVTQWNIYPMYHPSYVLRGSYSQENYRKDFENLVKILGTVNQTDVTDSEVRHSGGQRALDEFF